MDALLRVLSVDAALVQQQRLFVRDFPTYTVQLQAAAQCHQLLTSSSDSDATTTANDAAALAPLRPSQRLVALWLLMHVGRDDAPENWQSMTAPAQLDWHMQQLHHTPFLEPLLQILDGASSSSTPASSSQLTEHQRVERVFLTRMLLPAHYLPAAPLQSLLRLSEMSAATFLTSPATVAQQATFDDPAVLQEAIKPIRQIVQHNQLHPALIAALHPPSSDALLRAEMRVPASLVTSVLGADVAAALRSAEAASSAAFASAAAAASSSTLLLCVEALPPHHSGFSVSALDWRGSSGWETLLSDAAAADGKESESSTSSSPLPPEMSWMAWDPPEGLDWNLERVAPGASKSRSPSFSPTNIDTSSSFAQLLQKACKSQLLAPDKSAVIAELKSCEPVTVDTSSPNAAAEAALSASSVPMPLSTALFLIPPGRLPLLVEKNHEIAIELLRQLMLCNQHRAMSGVPASRLGGVGSSEASFSADLPRVNSYLLPLLSMDLSLHSMEVAKALCVVEPPNPPLLLPPDFLHLYVCKCMASCARGSSGQDKFIYVQHRHVRLVCAFITTLIRKKLIHFSSADQSPATAAAANGASASAATAAGSSSSSASSSSSVPQGSNGGGSDALLVEISAFLVEFASHKEAATLYKLIMSLQGNK
jgi:hypothetical protein